MEINQKCYTCTKPCFFRNWLGTELKVHSENSANQFEADMANELSRKKENLPLQINFLYLGPNYENFRDNY